MLQQQDHFFFLLSKLTPFLISDVRINGAVQSLLTNTSKSYPKEKSLLIACSITLSIYVFSAANFFGRKKGTSDPYFLQFLLFDYHPLKLLHD